MTLGAVKSTITKIIANRKFYNLENQSENIETVSQFSSSDEEEDLDGAHELQPEAE